MCPGLSEDLQQIADTRKTAIIDRELTKRNICIAALQETKLASSGSLREENYTFFWKGREPEEPRQHGVSFAVRNDLLPSVEPPSGGTERILTICLSTAAGPVSIVSVYAPTLCTPGDVKDHFYEQLENLIGRIPQAEPLLLLGDFNARVGADCESWPSCLGPHRTGRMNENGQRLLELCSFRSLCVTNTYFEGKPQHHVSWKHPRSHRWHQLDLIITRRSALPSFLSTRSYHSADCDTDHTLVCSKVKLQPKKIHRAKPAGRPRINVAKTANSDCKEDFLSSLEHALQEPTGEDATSRWNSIKDTIYNTAMLAFGKKARPSQDWFNMYIADMEPVIETKRQALLAYKETPNQRNYTALRVARSEAQCIERRCTNNFWLQLCESIQTASESGNIRGMFDGIKKAIGPTVKKTAPLKSTTGETIVDRNDQMVRWVEHYSELYSRETVVTETALNSIEDLPVMDELDALPTIEELSKAINALSSGKAPGSDGIPPEVIKCEKSALLKPLLELLHLCWEEGAVPQDMRDATIVTLYKNKGDRSDCNNYRGISLLSIVGKVFARILLTRLQTLAARIYPESQCGFRAGRSTIDMILDTLILRPFQLE